MQFNSVSEAQGQFSGYLFQLERGLFRLSYLPPEGILGIENGDDVFVQYDKKLNFEQDKNSISKKLPFSDLSSDLWKTLRNWLNLIKNNKGINFQNSSFYLISNKEIPSNRLIKKIDKCRENNDANGLEKYVQMLLEKGRNHNGELKPIIKEVLDEDFDFLIDFFNTIFVFDNKYEIKNNIRKTIKSNLHISDEIPFNNIYESLLGWLHNKVKQAWDNGENAIIFGNQLNSKLNELIALYKNKPFYERTIENIPISNTDRERHLNEIFIKQLELINVDDDEVFESIEHFLLASIEKTRIAKETTITKKDFEQFEQNLMIRWKRYFKPKETDSPPEKCVSDGKEIYYNTTYHREPLCGYNTEQYYLTKGTYHDLSNNLKIGWHPKWRILMKTS